MYAPALLVLPVLGYVAGRLAGGAATRAPNRTTAAVRLQRANRLLQTAIALVGVGLATAAPSVDDLAAAVPGPPPLGVFLSVVGSVFLAGVVPALAVHVGTRPAWSAITARRPNYSATVQRYVLAVTVLAGPAFLVVGAWLVAPRGLPGVVTVATSAIVVMGLLPVAVARVGPVRRPTHAEAASVPSCARRFRVRVVETGDYRVANALAAGLFPGAQYVFVTDTLLRTLDRQASAAVLAHEAGHHDRHHVAVRFTATTLALAPLFLVAGGVLDSFLLASVVSVLLLVAVGPLVRWTEFDADAYAARQVGPAPMERALSTLADRGLVAVERSRVAGLMALHPSIGQRVERLRSHVAFDGRR